MVNEKNIKLNNKKYILYNVSHYGHLVNVICHSMLNHSEKTTILLLDVGWLSEETLIFISSHIDIPGFSKVITYNESEIDKSDVNKIPSNIVDYFDSLLDSAKLELSNAEIVYSAFDTIHAFGIYLSHYEVHHTLFDFNLITSTDGSSNLFNRTEYHGLLKQYRALTWNSPLVDRVIYTLAENPDTIRKLLIDSNHPCMNRPFASGKSIEFFTLNTAFSKMYNKQRETIFSFYDLHKAPSEAPIVFLTSAFYLKKEFTEQYRSKMTWMEMYLYPYRILLDLVLGPCKKLIIKAHPNTNIPDSYVNRFFPNATYIPGFVPSDILGQLDLKSPLGISPGSNSIGTLPLSRKITLPRSFFNIFQIYSKIPFLIALCKFTKKGLSINGISKTDLVSMFNVFGNDFGLDVNANDFLTYYDSESDYTNDAGPSIVRLGHVPFDNDMIPGNQILVCYNGRMSDYSVPEDRLEYYRISGIDTPLNKFSFSREGAYSGIQQNVFFIPPYDFRSNGLFSVIQNEVDENNHVFIASKIDNYLKNPDNDEQSKNNALHMMLSLIDDGRYPNYLKNALGIMWNSKNPDNYPIMLEYINKYPSQPYSKRYLSMMYHHGKGVEKDLDKALDILIPLLYSNYDWSRTDSFDIIWDMGGRKDDMYAKLLSLFDYSKGSNLIRISKTYQFGRGNKKDLTIARDYALKATLIEEKWLKDYLGILLEIANHESYSKFYSTANKYSMKKHKDAIAAMGLAYRYGLGTAVDLIKAEEYEILAKKMGSNFYHMSVKQYLSH